MVFDRDYHTITDIYFKEFVNEDEAERYAKNNTWTGESYHVTKVENNEQYVSNQ
jgi:hypothetical protein